MLVCARAATGEIVLACGYVSPSHFQRQFRKIHGRSPKEYRLSVRQSF